MKETIIKKRAVKSRDGVPGVIEFGLEYLNGNTQSHWTITAWFEGLDKNGRKQEFFGCCHDEILAVAPDLKPFVDMHLSYADGSPMHADANAWYWLAGSLGGLGERFHGGNADRQHWKADGSFDGYRHSTPEECLDTFAKHCRIELDTARAIASRILQLWKCKCKCNARQEFSDWINKQLPRWKSESDSLLDLLNKMP